jgi:RNA polymerase sigma factor (sigma-70 family)
MKIRGPRAHCPPMPEVKIKLSRAAISLAAAAFRKYSPGLHRYLSRRIRESADVEDLTQEIFERFLRVTVADSIRNPQAYLFRIASHVVSDSLLRNEQSVVTYDSQVADEQADNPEVAAPHDMSDQIALSQVLHRALSQLPDMQRAVILLAVRDGLSHSEVACKTGLSVSTVGLYVCEARARIRAALSSG